VAEEAGDASAGASPQMLQSAWATSRLASAGAGGSADVVVFGNRLGPHPLLVFPPFAADAKGTAEALRPLEPMLRALDHPDGALAVPYHGAGSAEDAAKAVRAARAAHKQAVAAARAKVSPANTLACLPHPHGPADYEADGLLAGYAHNVAALMHCLGVSWTTALGYSLGGLAAAKTASLYPRIVGSLVLLDTPLLAATDAQTHALRNAIYEARYDINTPRADIDAAVAKHAELVAQPAATLSVPVAADAPVYEAIFDPAEAFSADKTSRDLGAFLSYDHLRALRHPVMSVYPNKPDFTKGAGATSAKEADALRDTVALRKALHVKAAAQHADLLGAAAAETAGGIKQWINRFDMDTAMARKYGQARDRVNATLNPPEKKAGGEGDGKDDAAAAGAKGGKKGKKSKKEKKAAKP
jgi:pimeloyl-ACP methyl ester carboxylesterase